MSVRARIDPPSLGSASFVAVKDLVNEKLITLCLIMSVVAVLTPMLLLMSVKVGFIDRLRSELIQDPSFREIRPQSADLRQEAFFVEVAGWNDVAFVMPSVMLVPREIDYSANGSKGTVRESAKLWPSAKSDPLFVKMDGTPPSGDGVVISADIAEKARIGIGSAIQISVTRIEADQRKRVTIDAKVVGIVPDELLPQPTILADQDIDRQVESFRAGVAVPERGWPGIGSVPKQSFSHIFVMTPGAVGENLSSNLRIRLGASRIVTMGGAEALGLAVGDRTGVEPSTDALSRSVITVIEREGRQFSGTDIREAADVLRNEESVVVGVNQPLVVSLLGQTVRMAGADPRLFARMKGRSDWTIRPDAAFASNDTVYLPSSLRAGWEAAGSPREVAASVEADDKWASRNLTVRVRVAGFSDAGHALASPSLLAMLYRGREIAVAFDPASRNIVEQASGYRGFRVVASDIDAVPGLVERFEAKGIKVRARTDEISKLQRLERSLNILIVVVGAVAVAGGLSILSSSFFANVQRKRVDFATIRLIGMRKSWIFRIPIMQAAIVAVLSFMISCACYFLVSFLLNSVIAAELGFDGQLSKLYPSHFLYVGIFVFFGSCLASLAASREATRIDPAQALRNV